MAYLRQHLHPTNEFGDCIVQSALTAPTTENTDENKLVRRRKRFPLSFILGGIAILAAVIYLISANTQANAVYYMTVNELRSCTTCTAQSVRVAGTVQAGSVVRDDQKQLITFAISDGGGQALPVTYTGVVPDIFRPGIQVVVEGHYSGHGPFQAQTLLAKCPSKFQSATPTP
jgi:cytochrome c-type biogenesis protein CcmE